MEQILSDILEHKTRRLLSVKDEKIFILETLRTVRLISELLQEEVHDTVIRMSERESLEWDSALRRLVYHRGETSQFLELAKKDVLFRVRPYLEHLLKQASENLR